MNAKTIAAVPRQSVGLIAKTPQNDSPIRQNAGVTEKAGLLAQIQADALNDQVSITSALRKCIVLGGESGSADLRAWAARELEGYGAADDLPDYRVIRAPLLVDGIAGLYQVTRQPFPPSSIPDFAQDKISERLELRYAVGNLEALLGQTDIRLQPPGASDLVRYMNMSAGTQIVALYWGVSPSEIHGVLDRIRTALTQLVVELRLHMAGEDEIPRAEEANQAVNVVINGAGSSVQINSAQASGPGAVATATASAEFNEATSLLGELEQLLREDGDAESAERVSHVATLIAQPAPDEAKLKKLWNAVKFAATTNEAVALIAKITPILLGLGHHL